MAAGDVEPVDARPWLEVLVARACGVLVGAVGAWALVARGHDAAVVIAPAAAVGLVLGGAALLLVSWRTTRSRRAARWTAWTLVAFSSVTIVRLAADVSWRLGDVLLRDAPARPGPMAPSTACGLLIVGLALVKIASRPRALAPRLATAAAALAFIATCGVLVGTGELGWSALRMSMPLHTACALVALGFGTIASRTGTGDTAAIERERGAAERRLAATADRLEVSLSASGAAWWAWDRESDSPIVSDAMNELFGFAPGTTPTYDDFVEVFHPDDKQRVVDANTRAMGEGGAYEETYRVVLPSGDHRWLRAVGRARLAADGSLDDFFGVAFDVTELKDEEREAEERESLLRRVLDSQLNFCAVVDTDGVITEINARVLQAGGLSREDYVGKTFWETEHWTFSRSVRRRIEDDVRRAARGELVHHDTLAMIGGKLLDIDFMITPVVAADGRVTHVIPSGVDISRRVAAEQAARREAERFRTAAGAADFGFYDADAVAGETYWSPEFRAIVGIAPDAPAAAPGFLPSFIHPDDRDRVESMLHASLDPNGDGTFDDELRIVRPDGTVRWVLMRGTTEFIGEGDDRRAVRAAGVLLDITERRKLADELVATTHRLEENDRRKDEFIATLGHEIRNPLSALDNATRALATGAISPRDAQPMITRHVKQLAHLVDDLLNVSRIRSGKVELELAVTHLGVVLTDAVAGVLRDIEAKQQHLDVSVAEDLRLRADPTRLEQVFANLLSNASRYTPEGGRIDVRAEADGEVVRVTVTDDGRGLGADELEVIFDPFVQSAPGEGGLGIGLALVRGLVALHDGRVTASSRGLGEGSTFTVVLPIGDVDARDEPPRPDAVEKASLDGLRVLVIDDLRDAADVLAKLLGIAGAETRCAYTGEAGIRLCLEWQPDAALVDIGLPDISGIEVAERVREAGVTSCLVALTGFGDEETHRRVQAAGFAERLVKPVDHTALKRILSTLLED